MDLLKQKEALLKRQIKTLDNTPKPSHSTYVPAADRKAPKKKRATGEGSKSKGDGETGKVSAANSANFGTLAQIVDFMKKRHLNQNTWALALKEILDEMQLDYLSPKTINWLEQALPSNPKLTAQMENDIIKYAYKPPYKIKNRNNLVSLLKKFHSDGKGALLKSELDDCILNSTQVMDSMGPQVIGIPTQVNKRKDRAYFYNDPAIDYKIDEEFVTLWRSVNVDHIDEAKISEYLQKHGIASVKDLAPNRPTGVPKRKATKRRANTKVQNIHLDGVLQEYDTGN